LNIILSSTADKPYCKDTISASISSKVGHLAENLTGDSHLTPTNVRLSSPGLRHGRKPKPDESNSGTFESLLLRVDAVQDRPHVCIASWRDILTIGRHVGRKEIWVLDITSLFCRLLLMCKKEYLNRKFGQLNSNFFRKN
jgi:hypothetical protein